MRWFALLGWLGLGILSAEAQRIDVDFSGAAIGSAKIDGSAGTIHFSPLQDAGLPRWYFRIQATQPGQVLNLVAPSSDELPAQAYVSNDAGKTWQRSAQAAIDEKLKQTSYEITAAASSCLFSSHLPFSHAMAAQWMEPLTQSHGIETLPFGPPEAGLTVLRFCEGDRVEARRPLIWVQAGYRAGEGAASRTAMGFCRWLAGVSSEAVWLRQNAEVLVLPLLHAASAPVISKESEESIDSTSRQFESEERLVTLIELRQGDAKTARLALREVITKSGTPSTSIPLREPIVHSIENWGVWPIDIELSSGASSRSSFWSLKIPWNDPEANVSTYEKLGAVLGEALAASLQRTSR